ncbi:MAG TPA: nucleotidyl transferase AbiEii/AbiGii toxin family protein [Planctomycetota bacterium]|nr:nucleotidyl transferase AbiEii/AbiGii toxin family protein [Planctomycetota bacterium]
MNELLARLIADLLALHARHAMVGGHAVSARTEPRFTRDLDLAVAVEDDHEAEALIRAMVARGYRPVALLEQDETGRLATVRLEHQSSPGMIVDLLFATAGIEPEGVAAATPLQVLAKLSLPVASVGHLLALKTLSIDDDRPHDRADLVALLRAATAEDIAEAELALRLIGERRCSRGRDLPTIFARLRAELGPCR